MARLTFYGAAETVTGSKYLLEEGDSSVLIDCGLFQGLKELRDRNWLRPPFSPNKVKSVVLTHAHIDHVGYLPKFVQQGFRGPVYCTKPTADIAELLLLDTAKIQEEDASYANRKGYSKHKPALPLYGVDDVKKTVKLFRTIQRGEWFKAAGPIWARYHDAGHLLGSSMIEVEIRSSDPPLKLLFSGDVGRYDAPLYHDPAPPPACDYLVCESTYGDRNHTPVDVLDELAKVVNDSVVRGGVMLVASFAVGRAQQLIYLLQILMTEKKIPPLPIFLDSPMAVSGMNIYRYYADEHDLSEGMIVNKQYAFDLDHVQLAAKSNESRQINHVAGPAVIISSSGMMTGGRILYHLEQRLPDAKNTVVLAGYMAEGTRGRLLQDGAQFLRMHGREIPVRAAIVQMSALSGHAGHDELIRWLSPLPPPKQTFITHGELPSATSLANELHATRQWNTVVPKMGQSFELTGP